MSSRAYDNYLAREHYVDSVACCECGYHRSGQHHPKVRCPKTGRCGECGNDWPCQEHAPKVNFMVYGAFTEPTRKVNFIIVQMLEGRQPWSTKICPAIDKLVRPWMDNPKKFRWDVDGDADPDGKQGPTLWQTKKALRYRWNGERLILVCEEKVSKTEQEA